MCRIILKGECGQGIVEYGLIIGLIAVTVAVILGLLTDKINPMFSAAKDALPS